MTFWLPIILSGVGATLSFFTMLCVAIIGWLAKYVMSSFERRIVSLETKTDAHAKHIASATTQTESEAKSMGELRKEFGELRDRFDLLSTQIANMLGTMHPHKRGTTK